MSALLRYVILVTFIAIALAVPAQAAVSERAVSIQTSQAGALSAIFYAPVRTGPAPGVLLLHTAGGPSEADRIFARNLAQAGYPTLVATYPIGWVDSANQALAQAVDWLREQPETRSMPVGVIGFSLGGSKALLVAALRPNAVKAVVAYYGTYNVEKSKFKDAARAGRSKSGQRTPSPVQVAARIGGPVLLLQGENDEETDPVQTAEMKAALEKAKKLHELVVFPGAAHMFEREPQFHPPGNRTRFGTQTGYQAAAAREAWQKTVDWLKRHLPSPPG